MRFALPIYSNKPVAPTLTMYKGEKFNSYTHLIGSIASVIGLFVLLYISVREGELYKIISFTIYGVSLVALYTCSTLYHSFRGKWKAIFQKLDHIAIYLLIAGTYTPFTLVTLRGEIGWIVFGLVWGLAITGILIDTFKSDKHRIIPLAIYLSMGWLVVLFIEPLMEGISMQAMNWLIAGGLFYTMGVIFYVFSNRHKLAHGIWHLFVMAGSLSHFITIAHFI